MMMPANFSAISENEMTYVNGGASLADILAPSLEVKNWQKFNTNMVTIIGNSFIKDTLGSTLGVAFSGVWGEKTGVKNADGDEIKVRIFGKDGAMHNWLGSKDDAYLGNGHKMSGLNKFMQGVGVLSAVYTLGTSTAKSYVGEADPFGVTGGAV